MVTFGAVTLLLLTALSGPATSDESLLAEFTDAHPDADIWPQLIMCEDCYPFGVDGPFAYGAWRITDLECAEDYRSDGAPPGKGCFDYLEWSMEGFFHAAYKFHWMSQYDDGIWIEEIPVFVGDVSALLGLTGKKTRLYLIQRKMYGAQYNLVEAGNAENVIKKVTEYSLVCEDAPKDSWRRLGYRYHARSLKQWIGAYCEIRNLEGFRNLARRVLKKKPTRIWEYIGKLPESVKKNGDDSG